MTALPIVNFVVEKTDTGFSAYASDYPIFTTGLSISDLMENVLEACSLHFEQNIEAFTAEHIKFEIDFQQFFQYYKVLNANHLAEKIGMNPTLLSQYVNGHKKPSAKQTNKILSGIHQIGQELSGMNFFQKA